MKLTTMISGLMAGLLLTTQLSAQPPARPQGQQAQQGQRGQQGQGQERTVVGFIARLRSMDANKDGKISKDELPERMQSILARVDSNKDNAIDDSELKALEARFTKPGNGGQRPQGDAQQGDRPQGQRPPGFGGQGGKPGQGGQPGGRPPGFGNPGDSPQGQRPQGFGGQGGRRPYPEVLPRQASCCPISSRTMPDRLAGLTVYARESRGLLDSGV